jgi:phosphoglycolate phosphatase
MSNLIAFDFDGVIADSCALNKQITSDICSNIAGAREVTDYDIEHLDGMSFHEIAKVIGVPEYLIDKCLALIDRELINAYPELKLFAGIATTIKVLSDADHQLAVVTNNTSMAVTCVLKKYDLFERFKDILGAESPGSKMDKLIALRSSGFDNCFMIGDSVGDIKSANSADFISVAVSWGFQSIERLMLADPDHVVNSPEELCKLCL